MSFNLSEHALLTIIFQMYILLFFMYHHVCSEGHMIDWQVTLMKYCINELNK